MTKSMDRRDFLRGSLAIGGVAAIGTLAGCASPKAPEADAPKADDQTAAVAAEAQGGTTRPAPDTFTDGKWIGTAMGHDDELIVELTVAGGDMAGLRVLRCDDTIGIGSTAAPMMAARILEAKDLDVDTVSGATTTSMAVRMATSDAISKIGRAHV